MRKTTYLAKFLLILFITAGFIFNTGCGDEEEAKKPEDVEMEKVPDDSLANEKTPEDSDSTETMDEPEEPVIPNITGTFNGKFGPRAATLKITSQNGTSFSGNITITGRETLNKSLNGTINPETNAVSMHDVTHSRYMGTYSGTISNNGNKISGTFTQNADNSTSSFSFTK